MSAANPAEAQRALLAQAARARARAADAVCRAGAADPFSPGCDTALIVLRNELDRISRLTPQQLLSNAMRAAA